MVFTDTSSGVVNSWEWDFGDGIASDLQHPVHIYQKPGIYSVTLQVMGPGGVDALTQEDLVHAIAPAGFAVYLPLLVR